MFKTLCEKKIVKGCFAISMVAVLAGCATSSVQGEAQTISGDAETTLAEEEAPAAEAGSFCDDYATQPNYRLWNGIDETSNVTTYIRNGANGEVRYCVRFEIEGDPDVISGAGCASSPDLAIATFAQEFPAYLCGVTNE